MTLENCLENIEIDEKITTVISKANELLNGIDEKNAKLVTASAKNTAAEDALKGKRNYNLAVEYHNDSLKYVQLANIHINDLSSRDYEANVVKFIELSAICSRTEDALKKLRKPDIAVLYHNFAYAYDLASKTCTAKIAAQRAAAQTH